MLSAFRPLIRKLSTPFATSATAKAAGKCAYYEQRIRTADGAAMASGAMGVTSMVVSIFLPDIMGAAAGFCVCCWLFSFAQDARATRMHRALLNYRKVVEVGGEDAERLLAVAEGPTDKFHEVLFEINSRRPAPAAAASGAEVVAAPGPAAGASGRHSCCH